MLRKIKYKIILVHRTRKQHLSYPACWLKRLLSTTQRRYPLTYIASMSASKISVCSCKSGEKSHGNIVGKSFP